MYNNHDELYYKKKYLKYKLKYINLKGVKYNIVSLSNKVKPLLGTIKKAIPYVKVGLTGAATVASLGLGGDEPVKLAFVVLDTLLIIDDFSNLYSLEKIPEYADILNDIINLKFIDFKTLIDNYDNIKKKIDALPENIKSEFVTKLCECYHNLLLKISTLIGDLLSLAFPNDANISSLLFTKFVDKNINNNIEKILSKVTHEYENLPNSFVELIKDEEKLGKTINKIFKIVLALNTAKDLGIMALVDPLTPLFVLIIKYNKTIAKSINYSFALLIIILKFLEDECK